MATENRIFSYGALLLVLLGIALALFYAMGELLLYLCVYTFILRGWHVLFAFLLHYGKCVRVFYLCFLFEGFWTCVICLYYEFGGVF